MNRSQPNLRQRLRWFWRVFLLLACSLTLAEVFVFFSLTTLIKSLRPSVLLGAAVIILLAACVIFGIRFLLMRRRSKRRFQFTVRTMLVIMVALCWPIARLSNDFRNESHRVNAQMAAHARLGELNAKEIRVEVRDRLKRSFVIEIVKTPLGLRDMRTVVTLQDIVYVDLSGSGTSDEKLSVLAELNGIEELNLSGTQLTDAGLEYLYGLTNLRKLSVKDTNVTEQGLKKLRERLPATSVEF